MEESGSLGLFIAPDKALAVWIGSGSDSAVLHQLAVKPDTDEPSTIALQAARAVRRQGNPFDEAFIAIDCSYYSQYKLHSEFDDYHQVESTIKFDAEEAAATDAMNLAVTFDIIGKQQVGSEVTAYTADRQLLTDILLDVQEGALDPTVIEPDVVCLARALSQAEGLSEHTDTMFIVLSKSSCYMIRPQTDFAAVGRTLLIGRGQNVTNMLAREIMLAAGSAAPDHPLKSIVLFGDAESVDKDLLNQRTGLEVRLEQSPQFITEALAQDSDIAAHEIMIAYGAALAAGTRGHKADFRRDFMPYQGRRKVMEKSLRLIAISLTILMVVLAVFFQLKTFKRNRATAKLNDKLYSESELVLQGRKIQAPRLPSSYLRSELKKAKQLTSGDPGDDKSIPAKLTFFFEAVNKTPKNVDINIRQVSISDRSMSVKGDTNSRTGTMALFNEIKKHPRIKMNGERVSKSGNRDTFQFNVEPNIKAGTRR